MVYKIIGDFNTDNFEIMLSKIRKYYKFIYQDDNLYVALTQYKLKEEAYKELKKSLKPARNFIVREVNENNLGNENDFVIEWCRDSFVEIERQRYEIEKQQKLRDTMKALDNFDRILAEQQKAKQSTKTTNKNTKKGGNDIGQSQKKRKTQKG